jgi:hypothetical protein
VKTNKFKPELHEDLFDLFVMAYISDGLIGFMTEDTLKYCREKKDSTFYMFRDLLPRENFPEQYEIYINDFGKSKYNQQKILITVVE